MEPVIERPALPVNLPGLVQSLMAVCQQYGQRINQLILGPHYSITDAERAAGVTPVDHRYPELNVLRYGTNTTPGTTDMTAAINAAIDVAAQKGGGRVFVPKGTYLVRKPGDSGPGGTTLEGFLKGASGVTIEGEGFESVIMVDPTSESIRPIIGGWRLSRFEVRNIRLVGAASGNVTFLKSGIYLAGGPQECKVIGCHISNVDYDGILLIGLADGRPALRNTIANNVVTACGDDGINIGAANEEIIGTIVANNHVYDVGSTGIHVSDGADKTLVIGNEVTGCGVHGIDTYSSQNTVIAGNASYDNTIAAFLCNSGTDGLLSVTNNFFKGGSATHGVCYLGAAAVTAKVLCSGNVVDATNVELGISCNHAYAHIVGNYVINATSRGILVSRPDTAVIGNRVVDCAVGICIDTISSRNRVDSNIVVNATTHGIQVSVPESDPATDIAIANNQILGGCSTAGILMFNVLGSLVTGNVIADISGTAYTETGTSSGNQVRNNLGHTTENKGTATIANGTTSIAVTHGLSVTPSAGDVMVTPTGNLGSATKFWVDTYTSTQFTIHVDVNPGTDVTFAWTAQV